MDESNIGHIVQSYLNHCRYEKGLDTKTLKAYKTDITQLTNYIGKTGGHYSKECIQAYIVSLHDHYAVKSVKRKIASLKAFFNYLEYEEILLINPFSKIRVKLHEPFLLARTIPLAEIGILLGCAYSQITKVFTSSFSGSSSNSVILPPTGIVEPSTFSVIVHNIVRQNLCKIFGRDFF